MEKLTTVSVVVGSFFKKLFAFGAVALNVSAESVIPRLGATALVDGCSLEAGATFMTEPGVRLVATASSLTEVTASGRDTTELAWAKHGAAAAIRAIAAIDKLVSVCFFVMFVVSLSRFMIAASMNGDYQSFETLKIVRWFV